MHFEQGQIEVLNFPLPKLLHVVGLSVAEIGFPVSQWLPYYWLSTPSHEDLMILTVVRYWRRILC